MKGVFIPDITAEMLKSGCLESIEALMSEGEIYDIEYPNEKTGEWIGIEYDGYSDGHPVYDVWECSNCHEEHEDDYDSLPRYCPNCGARMKGEEKG